MIPLIKITDLSYKVGQRYLLNHINWEVMDGQNWIVFGLNGSGKTTLLSIIAGFKTFTAGKLEILGQTYHQDNILAIRQQIGWVSSSFFDKYLTKETVLHVVLSGCSGTFGMHDTIQDADVRRAKALLTELRIEQKINVPYFLLSKGERQNVLIARALIAQPRILLLDEPDNGLDIYAREHMQNTIQALAGEKKITMIYVTHYPERILPQFDHCLLLRYGQVFAQGSTETLFTSERMSKLIGENVSVFREAHGGYQMKLHITSHIQELCYQSQEEVRYNGNL